MITDAFLWLLGNFFNFLVALIPNFTFLETLSNAKTDFVNFISGFISNTLYIFNVPVLRISMTLLFTYITFLLGEYFIKLFIKYSTNIL